MAPIYDRPVPVRFGATIPQVVPFPLVRDDFRFIESLGIENGWVADHFAVDGAGDMAILEPWTLLAAVATETERIRIGTMVTNVSTRNVGMLAKAILTVDQISNGRVDVGLGAGFYPVEHAALGIDFLDSRRRVERLGEATEILDRALRGEHVTYQGSYFRLVDAPFHPQPTQRPRPPVWVAAQGTRSLRIAARHADAVVCLGEAGTGLDDSLSRFRERMARLDELCAAEGRDAGTLRRCYFAGWANEPIFESSDATADFIGRYVEAGATDFTFRLHNLAAPPHFEQALAAHRIATRDQFASLVADVLPAFTKP
jgi:alkanesulfonate monooxygenase SsuD/methylene tetrahydromethanopterin reductase-like flavin-dependent oxidoreductase (luciferase family)